MFFFHPPSLKILLSNFWNFLTFCPQHYSQQMEKNIRKLLLVAFKKIWLQNCKISSFAYSFAGRFLKQFSTANLNNFQRINLWKFYTFVNDDTPRYLVKKLEKFDVGFLGEGWAVKYVKCNRNAEAGCLYIMTHDPMMLSHHIIPILWPHDDLLILNNGYQPIRWITPWVNRVG